MRSLSVLAPLSLESPGAVLLKHEIQGGYFIFVLMDWYSGSWSLIFLAVLEVILVAWVSFQVMQVQIFSSTGLQTYINLRRNTHPCNYRQHAHENPGVWGPALTSGHTSHGNSNLQVFDPEQCSLAP